jgi:hypothetical protein
MKVRSPFKFSKLNGETYVEYKGIKFFTLTQLRSNKAMLYMQVLVNLKSNLPA